MPFALVSWPSFAIAAALALALGVVAAAILGLPIRLLARRRGWSPRFMGRVLRPLRALLVVVALLIAVELTLPARAALPTIEHGARILIIASVAWLIAGVVSFGFEVVLERHPMDMADNRVARRVRTQVSILRRISLIAVAIVGVGAVLLTFPGVEAVGASVLASAGLASVVAGLAAQSTLANVFAGLQLAFSDAIRVDDVVIAEEEWGRIEEITLTYVVVRLWDDRRLVLPSTYFTQTPFQNWTRRESELLGAVEFDVDWRVDLRGLRDRLDAVLAESELWDGRTKVLQVTDAVGGLIRVRILVTAADAGTLFDLRCQVREAMVEQLVSADRRGLPVQRLELGRREDASPRPARRAAASQTEGLFSGSPEADARNEAFTQSMPVVPARD
ncbi:mechanosensitive ion channel family protein [Homoserinibacter sp. YIM 151385]|uniref:mechanosensitive ion channel family protein n=1 Tax=Homoserinibacter sp. YIM 151385 TaxID=2985506 RepID=UPI0022F12D72|nr:mechanosensitive ion channel domain-containing protein [Homoserinibacter sp. YIM 151385]WBU37371.1 mechanosensitive ion channel [Homoserinibacter sp. YIM 151385]